MSKPLHNPQDMHPETKEPPVEGESSTATLCAGARLRWLLLLLVFAAGLVYVPSLRYGFVWDDRALIAENKDLDSTNPLEFFSQSFTHYWARQGLVPDAYYRPFVILSFWVERRLFGTGPAAFHLMNVLWNAAAGMLVALLLVELLGGFWPALLGGLAFALHPMHVESVAFVSDRTDLMMTVFLLLAFLALLRYRARPSPRWIAAAALFFGLSLLCKEAAILFPVLAFLVLCGFLQGDTPPRTAGSHPSLDSRRIVVFGVRKPKPGEQDTPHPNPQEKRMKAKGEGMNGERKKRSRSFLPQGRARRADWLLLALLVAVAALYLVVRSLVLGGASAGWGDVTIVQRALLVVNAFGRYVFLSLVPFWHRLTYPDLARFSSIGWPTIVGAIALVGLVWLAWRFRSSPRGLGAAWFVLFMLPASDFFPPGPSYLSERLLYLPTVGMVLMAAAFLVRIRRASLRRPVAVAVIMFAVAMGINTLARLPVWRDEVALHTTMVRENPDDGKAYSNLARALKEAGDTRAALPEYRRAAELQPQSADAQYDLGEALKAAGDPKGAATAYRKAVALDPKSNEMQTNLGNVLIELGDVQGAVAAYRQAATLNPKQAMGHNNLGVALQQGGDVAGAESEFRRALEMQPDLGLALNNLGEIVMTRGKLDSAEQLFRRTVAAQPGYALGHYNLGLVLQRTGRPAEAESEYRRTLELMPSFNTARERLQELQGRK